MEIGEGGRSIRLWEIGMGVAVKGRGARGGGLEVLLGGATR